MMEENLFREAQEHYKNERYSEAISSLLKLLKKQPNNPNALLVIGVSFMQQGDTKSSTKYLSKAVKLVPNNPMLLSNYANALRQNDENRKALDVCNKALRINPHHYGAVFNRALINQALNHDAEAIRDYLHAIDIDNSYISAHLYLSKIYESKINYKAAIEILLKAFSVTDSNPEIFYLIGKYYYMINCYDDGLTFFDKSLKIRPMHEDCLLKKARCQSNIGMNEDAVKTYETFLSIYPDNHRVHDNLLIEMHYINNISNMSLFNAHLQWAKKHANKDNRANKSINIDIDGVINIGFLSSRFTRGPIYSFFYSVLKELSTVASFRCFLYATSDAHDDITDRFIEMSHEYRNITELNDDDLEKEITKSGIVVLFDLCGHSPGNRLKAFSKRLAPIQISWLDYFNTTGVAEMDYFVSDEYLTPSDSSQHYVEKLLLHPLHRLCYTKKRVYNLLTERYIDDKNRVVYGSFQRTAKINDSVISTWSNILHKVSGSILVLKSEDFSCSATADKLRQRFFSHGIDPLRIKTSIHSSYDEYMEEYLNIDVALDPFPFTGCTTTCDALWMGTPVVTLTGETLVSRQSAGILRRIGLNELIASSKEEYVDIAIRVAGNQCNPELSRSSIHNAFSESVICDAELYSVEFIKMIEKVIINDQPTHITKGTCH